MEGAKKNAKPTTKPNILTIKGEAEKGGSGNLGR